jgi:hypothetical protein
VKKWHAWIKKIYVDKHYVHDGASRAANAKPAAAAATVPDLLGLFEGLDVGAARTAASGGSSTDVRKKDKEKKAQKSRCSCAAALQPAHSRITMTPMLTPRWRLIVGIVALVACRLFVILMH